MTLTLTNWTFQSLPITDSIPSVLFPFMLIGIFKNCHLPSPLALVGRAVLPCLLFVLSTLRGCCSANPMVEAIWTVFM